MGEAEVFDAGAGTGAGEFVRILYDLEDESEAASFRWMLDINTSSVSASSCSPCQWPLHCKKRLLIFQSQAENQNLPGGE